MMPLLSRRVVALFCLAAPALAGIAQLAPGNPADPKTAAGTTDPATSAANPFGTIEAKPNTPLERDYRKLFCTWCDRELVQPAKARLAGSPQETEALKFIEAVISVYGEDEACKMPDELRDSGPSLEKAGCKDPLVFYLAGRCSMAIYGADHDYGWRAHFLGEAARMVEKAESHAGVLGVLILWEKANLKGTSSEARSTMDDKAAAWMVEALSDHKTYAGEEIVIFLRQLKDTPAGEEHFKRAHERYAGFFESEKEAAAAGLPEWARQTLLGFLDVRRAWRERGAGVADTVTPEGWEGFKKHLAAAHRELTRAWKLRPDLPYAAREMIAVTMGGMVEKEETTKLWFERAIAAQFDYEPAYRALLWAMRPRWGGSYDQMLALACACMDTARYDTGVPRIFVRACADIADELHEDWPMLYRRQPEIARRMVELHRKLLAEPSREPQRWLDRSNLAVNSWLVGDYAVAEQALGDLGKRLHRCAVSTLRKYAQNEATFRSEIAVRRSPAADKFNEAEMLLRSGEYERARPLFESALDATPEKHRPFVQARLMRISLAKDLAGGDWVRLPVKPDLALWRRISGRWEGKEYGVLICPGHNESNLIVLAQPPGENFEFRAEFANLPGDGKTGGLPSSGMVLGYRDYEDREWLTPYLYQRKSGSRETMAQLRKGWGNVLGVPDKAIPLKEWNQFHVIVRDGRVTFLVNGTPVLVEFEPPKGDASGLDGMIGFTSYLQTTGTLLQIRNIELRQLR